MQYYEAHIYKISDTLLEFVFFLVSKFLLWMIALWFVGLLFLFIIGVFSNISIANYWASLYLSISWKVSLIWIICLLGAFVGSIGLGAIGEKIHCIKLNRKLAELVGKPESPSDDKELALFNDQKANSELINRQVNILVSLTSPLNKYQFRLLFPNCCQKCLGIEYVAVYHQGETWTEDHYSGVSDWWQTHHDTSYYTYVCKNCGGDISEDCGHSPYLTTEQKQRIRSSFIA